MRGSACWSWLRQPMQAALIVAPDGDQSTRVSIAEYRKHLEDLDALVATCQKQRSAEACDRASVGPDDKVQWTTRGATIEREVRYDWLRDLLDRAGKKGETRQGRANQAKRRKLKPALTLKRGPSPP